MLKTCWLLMLLNVTPDGVTPDSDGPIVYGVDHNDENTNVQLWC